MKNLTILSMGSFGLTIALLLAGNGHNVTVWGRNKSKVEEISKTRKSDEYLPGILIPDGIAFTSSHETACEGADIIMSTTPSEGVREVFELFKPYIKKHQFIINGAKGLERETLKRITEVIEEIYPENKVFSLSGPGHAEEIALRQPTTYVISSIYESDNRLIQDTFSNSYFRVYTNDDIVGVELGGALKNVIALAAGISDGMGFGDNAKAALMTRGIAEISRLGVAMGAKQETFSGLSGVGDVIVTCTSMHSRNRRAGILLGQGKTLEETLGEVHMVVEGVKTTESAYALAKKYNVEMPIVTEIYNMLFNNKPASEALLSLMGRDRRGEEASMG